MQQQKTLQEIKAQFDCEMRELIGNYLIEVNKTGALPHALHFSDMTLTRIMRKDMVPRPEDSFRVLIKSTLTLLPVKSN
jgi:hypothetical protein